MKSIFFKELKQLNDFLYLHVRLDSQNIGFEIDILKFKETIGVVETLNQDIDVLYLSNRATKALREKQINKIKDIIALERQELLRIKNISNITVSEIEERLRVNKFKLGKEHYGVLLDIDLIEKGKK